MMERIKAGYQPQGPIEGPNIWKVFAGDRIVWVGAPGGGVQAENAILEMLDFNQTGLVYGEPFDTCHGFPTFGDLDRGDVSPGGLVLCQSGWDAVNQLGLPRVLAADDQWRIG